MEDIKTEPKSMLSLVNDINKNRYNFNLSIQRRAGIWKRKELSLFIDSILRLYPIYPALLNKHSDTKILDVVDFKQRFTGLASYVNNEFPLSKDIKPLVINGVEYEIAGKKFNALDEVVQERFYSRDISVITMVDATPEEISEIFDRINMGHPLSNGHKRSTIESEQTRNIIYTLASHPFFEKVLTKAQYKKNVDRDTIIQILMLCESSAKYDFGSFRNDDMNKFILHFNQSVANDQTRDKALGEAAAIKDALDKLAGEFRKPVKIKPTSLPLICYGMYKVIKDGKPVDAYLKWVHDFLNTYDSNETYLAYCGSGTASAEMVKGRLSYFEEAINRL